MRAGIPLLAALAAATAVIPATAGEIRLVARRDFSVSTAYAPPAIGGRTFWTMIGGWLRATSEIPESAPASPQGKIALSDEPMVREAALHYSRGNLLNPGPDPLVVNGDRLSEYNFGDRPFILAAGSSRPLFKCLEDFRVNGRAYRRWKREHPLFLGFSAGDEYDSDYIGFLTQPDTNRVAQRLRDVFRCSETAVARAITILTNAAESRDAALAGARAGYDAAARYYFGDRDKMLFLHSAWCVDHDPLDWGAGMMILETSGTGAYRHQAAMTFTRGAARQYGKPWNWYLAVCYNGLTREGKWDNNAFPYCLTTNAEPVAASGHVRGPTCGMSVSLNRRDMYLAYLAGASIVQHETWPYAYWQFNREGDARAMPVLSPYGESMKEWYAFTQRHPERGVSYAPIALLLPANQGYPQWGCKAWSLFPMTRADTMIDAFFYTLVPQTQTLSAGQEGCLANSEYGDVFDVLMPNPPSGPVPLATLANYKAAILLGQVNADAATVRRLMAYVKRGGTLVVNTRQLDRHWPDTFLGVHLTGQTAETAGSVRTADGGAAVTLAEPYEYDHVELRGAAPLWIDERDGILATLHVFGRGRVVLTTADFLVPRKGFGDNNDDTYIKAMKTRTHPLVQLLMRQVVRESLPLAIEGDIEYGLNKVPGGWWVYLINNKGVTKFTRTAETLDPGAAAAVTLQWRDLDVTAVRELRSERDLDWDRKLKTVCVTVGPGDIQVIRLTAGP